MQEHLAAAIPAQQTTGIFDATTAANLAAFQASHALPVTATTTVATWQALLALTPIVVDWSGPGVTPPVTTTTTTTGPTGPSGPTGPGTTGPPVTTTTDTASIVTLSGTGTGTGTGTGP